MWTRWLIDCRLAGHHWPWRPLPKLKLVPDILKVSASTVSLLQQQQHVSSMIVFYFQPKMETTRKYFSQNVLQSYSITCNTFLDINLNKQHVNDCKSAANKTHIHTMILWPFARLTEVIQNYTKKYLEIISTVFSYAKHLS